jgi:hypothetical protein
MSETMGRLVTTGQGAEVFEWGSRVVKLYRSAAAKNTAFREAAIHAAVEALGLPVPTVWSVQQIDRRWGIVFDRVSGGSLAEQMRGDAGAIPQVSSDPRAPACSHSCPSGKRVQQPEELAGNEHRPNHASRRAEKAALTQRPRRDA